MYLNTEDATYTATYKTQFSWLPLSPSTACGCKNHGQYIISSLGDHGNIQYWTNVRSSRLLNFTEIRRSPDHNYITKLSVLLLHPNPSPFLRKYQESQSLTYPTSWCLWLVVPVTSITGWQSTQEKGNDSVQVSKKKVCRTKVKLGNDLACRCFK